MPIGKNSLKRVTNNGYSQVATSAPDMENSEVSLISEAEKHTEEILAPKTDEGKAALARAKEKASEVAAKVKKAEKPEAKEKKPSAADKAKETVKSMTAEEKKAAKPAAKKPAAKKTAAKRSAPKADTSKEEAPVTSAPEEDSTTYVNLGRGNLPSYLL